ncbi:heavy-metal-associated domain-containing protein [Winogradskyella litorisediminis]|uniref:Heavy-metal-associated domain-containing protein n=1 Tax=Winogradskyella litorisediminis TaxID=1156618 RepID=A0ABW3N8D8_9FLAO
MKKIITLIALFISIIAFSQNKNAKQTIEVDGVCMMCKDRIEKAAIRTKGVKSAIWNVKTHELKLIFDERKTNVETISKKLAQVGHDTKAVKATEEAYNSVHPCCRYRDEDVKKEHEN